MSPSFPLSCLARAVLLAGLSLGAATTVSAQAPAPAAQAPVRVDIPAGPLDQVLTRYAATVGTPLTIDPTLTAGKTSPGLAGTYDVRGGLDALLAGTGLSATPQAGGGYTLVKAPAAAVAAPAGETALPAVKIRSTAVLDATTEGTGSYTTGQTSASTGLNLSLRETPQSVTVLTRQRIEDQAVTQLNDVVDQVTGLTMSQSGNAGSDSTTYYSRGFPVENYLIDGIGQNYSNYGAIYQTVDLAPFDRLEVVRGASGLINGLGSPGATLNLVRKKPTAEFQASGRVTAGSWNYYRADVDVAGPFNEAGTLRGRAVAALQDNDSYIDRLNEKSKVLYGILEADLTPTTLATAGISVQHHDATGHARGGRPAFATDGSRVIWDRSDSAAANWAYSKRRNTSLFASLEQRLDAGWTVKGTVSRNQSRYDELLGYAAGGNLVPGTGGGITLYGSGWDGQPEQDNIDLRASGPFEAFGRKHELLVGFSSARTSDSTTDFPGWTLSAIPDIYTWDGNTPAAPVFGARGMFGYTERLTSAFSSARLKATDELAVILGARVTNWRTTTAYADADWNPVSYDERQENGQVTPFAGLVYDFSKEWSAYTSYTNIFKPQTAQTETGQYLQPQIGNTFEVGVKAALFDNQLNLSAAIYRIEQDNFAVAIPDAKVITNGNQAYRAESGTLTRGFELEASGALTRNWQLSAGFARNLARARDGSPLDPSVPANTLKLFSTYRLTNVGDGLTLGGGLRWQSKTYTDNSVRVTPAIPVRFEQDAYTVVDLMARYQVNRNVAVSLNINNVFDESYYTSTWNSYYGAPRHARASLDVKF